MTHNKNSDDSLNELLNRLPIDQLRNSLETGIKNILYASKIALQEKDYKAAFIYLNQIERVIDICKEMSFQVPAEYATMKKEAYTIGVSKEFEYAKSAYQKKDYLAALLTFNKVECWAKNENIELPLGFKELKCEVIETSLEPRINKLYEYAEEQNLDPEEVLKDALQNASQYYFTDTLSKVDFEAVEHYALQNSLDMKQIRETRTSLLSKLNWVFINL